MSNQIRSKRMEESKLLEIENEINKLPRSWFFHDYAVALVKEVRELQEENKRLKGDGE